MPNFTLLAVVFWTGFAMWPTHIDTTFVVSGVETHARFYRDGVGSEWSATAAGDVYTIRKPLGGDWQLEDSTLVVGVLGDEFWLQAEHSAVFASGAGILRIDSSRVDWLDVRVVWLPVLYGFLTGMLFDLATAGPFLILRTIARGSSNILPTR